MLAPYVLYTFRQYLNSSSESGKPPTNYECGILPGRTNPFPIFTPIPGTTHPPLCPIGSLHIYPNPPHAFHPLSQPVPTPPLVYDRPVLPPLLPFYIPFPRYTNAILVPIPRFHPPPSPSPTRPFILILQPTAYTVPYVYIHVEILSLRYVLLLTTVFPPPLVKPPLTACVVCGLARLCYDLVIYH